MSGPTLERVSPLPSAGTARSLPSPGLAGPRGYCPSPLTFLGSSDPSGFADRRDVSAKIASLVRKQLPLKEAALASQQVRPTLMSVPV